MRSKSAKGKSSYNPVLKATIIEAVENQIKENNPPIVSITYNRLTELGYSDTRVKEMIAAVLLTEMYDVLKNKVPFNEEKYTSELKKLKQ